MEQACTQYAASPSVLKAQGDEADSSGKPKHRRPASLVEFLRCARHAARFGKKSLQAFCGMPFVCTRRCHDLES
jgi:hypothetical protein